MTRSHVSFMLHRVFERLTAGVGAVILTACMLMISDARAEPVGALNIAPSVSVKYSPDQLTTEKGAADVYRKLRFAARKVCGVGPGVTTLEYHVLMQSCYEKTLANAVRQIDRPLLSSLHAAATTRRAS